jgi:hypothetical protein
VVEHRVGGGVLGKDLSGVDEGISGNGLLILNEHGLGPDLSQAKLNIRNGSTIELVASSREKRFRGSRRREVRLVVVLRLGLRKRIEGRENRLASSGAVHGDFLSKLLSRRSMGSNLFTISHTVQWVELRLTHDGVNLAHKARGFVEQTVHINLCVWRKER